ncbi:E3 ubiquitin-protein ligase SINA-like 10 [Phragmites australis]|uniref:E3 ubiquitin-protein ligase SINA-like 10 n=1 Tax=Phragmites australis TaxID=29695 RepID=UPI002D79F465|nr:E3 ubiquitin-protein ligase SINA-like 10 [Phragmites australis]
MAKFSFDDAEEDPPAAASGGDKRKREDGPPGGAPPKARNLAVGGGEPDGSATVGEERAEGSGRKVVETGGGEADEGISVRIDPDVLDCSICFEPLRPPLYQCQNGHVACFSCWSRLSNKCHICSHDANFARNIALEKIVESVKSSCSYANWGCSKLVSYSLRDAHEESCLFAPSVCPIPGCGYRGFTGWWSGHFFIDHNAEGLRFMYGQHFEVNLEMSVPFLVLLAEDDHLFLVLNKNVMPFGHAFSVVCLRTGNLNWNFLYEIKAISSANTENSLQLKASVTNTREWGGLHPTEAFLLVPYVFCKSSKLTLNLSIERFADVGGGYVTSSVL